MSRPDAARTLARLKDFQRATVDCAFQRLYLDEPPARRFLVADEVGLGKTLVARGVIARAVERLWGCVPRIDILYICSNGDIANQNVRRLRIEGQEEFARASRITLLPLIAGELNRKPEPGGSTLNFVSLTPGTSFDYGKQSGAMKERALLYELLREPWNFHGAAPMNVLQGGAGTEGWRDYLSWFRDVEANPLAAIPTTLVREFVTAAEADGLRTEFEALCEIMPRARHLDSEERSRRNALVGSLRRILARLCIAQLEPDLIILDEFQRFRHLLQGGEGYEEVTELARGLFEFKDARTLLLSATPYKMYTVAEEAEGDDHYRDFLQTADFLFNAEDQARALGRELQAYRVALCRGDGSPDLATAKAAVERRLRRVMCRTERLGVDPSRNGMLVEAATRAEPLDARDLRAFQVVDRVAQAVGSYDSIEMWKSAPYLLNLMEDYQLKKKVELAVEGRNAAVCDALKAGQDGLFPAESVEAFQPVDVGNARLRALMAATVERAWKLLWMPASLPYYAPGGVYAEPAAQNLTKALVFSSWQVVPKAIAILASYEPERRMAASFATDLRYAEPRKQQAQLLRFASDEGRLAGMPLLTLVYPSPTLAHEIDPLAIARHLAGQSGAASAADVVREACAIVGRLLGPLLPPVEAGGPPDERWYWAALLKLDRDRFPCVREWMTDEESESPWAEMAGETETVFGQHVDRAAEFFDAPEILGPPPADLIDVIARVALASPAVATLRSLARRWPDGIATPDLLGAAAYAAMGFRRLFNRPEVIWLLRGLDAAEPYWRRVLDYGLDGNLQAVMDEYVHVLVESESLRGDGPEKAAPMLGSAIHDTVALTATRLGYDHFVMDSGSGAITVDKRYMRCRFAMRFGEGEPEEVGGEATRQDRVRSAFNSPFYPFILASTSVGQEGLDFHSYCHALYHWNLPSNPVDLEQREGRIHRYKGHVIRKNVASRLGLSVTGGADGDPWDALFAHAAAQSDGGGELVPYWVYDGTSKIERHLPLFALSRDVARAEHLKRSLALYRLVFGQPRQEELLRLLRGRADQGALAGDLLRIDLRPGST